MREKNKVIRPEEVESRLLPLLDAGALVPLRVTGHSMSPFLRHGRDTVYLRSPAVHPPKAGDVLFFRRADGRWILHRFCRLDESGGLVMNGDAQTWFETIAPEQVFGVVEQVGRGDRQPVPARRWDRELARIAWEGLRPVRPWLLRQLGRAAGLLRGKRGGS